MKNWIGILTLAMSATALAEDSTEGDQLFTLKIQPLLSEKCNGCHGDDAEKIKGGYDILSREGLLAGGEEFGEDALVPGDAAKSFIVETVKWADPDWEMPPKENDRLTPAQIEELERWINLGAPWPNEEVQDAIRTAESKKKETDEGIMMETSGGLGDEWTFRRYKSEDIWAFMPVVNVKVPGPDQTGLGQGANPVDSFINAKLKAAGFEPARQADAATLIRRASYDLIGLPPTPGEREAFEASYAADSEKAWADLISRLLASPHYGERWAQHWMDVARYADTGGMSNDYERSNAWRYRDYVIRAFNEDKPYDQFVIEQIAGDELADASVRKRLKVNEKKLHQIRLKGEYNEKESELIVAAGFLRMGPWDNAMVKAPEARQLYLDDVLNGVGQTFLATTMRCFKCHDHKFDPLPTKDYYRMYSALSTTQMAERKVPLLSEENREGFEEGKAFVGKMHSYALDDMNRLRDKREAAARKWFEERGLKYLSLEKRKGLPDEEKPPRHVGLDNTEKGILKVREQDDWVWERRKDRYLPIAQSVYSGTKGKGNARELQVFEKLLAAKPEQDHILTGGSLEAKGDPVTPGVISSVGVPVRTYKGSDPYALPESAEGRRTALAHWIADPENSLATRSIVNRVWQGHFGHGIARNPNNFGVKGAKPSHPELLDWLTKDFVEKGWTFKRLHRSIMMSETYRRSAHYEKLEYIEGEDPNNELLAYYPPRRLTAEELRDSLLSITGELNPSMGGLPALPEINMEVALQPRMIQFSLAPAYQPHPEPKTRNRRSIYAYRVRGMADPFLELFNQPNPNDSCEFRDSAAVTPQVFTMLNSDLMTDRAIAFALRLKREGSDLKKQIDEAFQLVLGRSADEVEMKRLSRYVVKMTEYHEGITPRAREYPLQITRLLIEEFSGEPFEYEEILPYFENYEPDKKASDVDAETRALADLCLLLFNSNEFVYLY